MHILTRRPGESITIETPAGERIQVAGPGRDWYEMGLRNFQYWVN